MPVNSFENFPMSWKPMINKKDKPLYKILANSLESDIKRGKLKPGDKLPPQRELADYLDVNLSTITRAFKICEMKGLICGTIGRGTYISQDIHPHLPMLLQQEPYGLINMGASHPLSTQNPIIESAMKQILKKGNVRNILNYSEPLGKEAHRRSGVKWLEQFHLSARTEDIMITSGLQNSLAVTLTSLFEAGDKIAVPPLIYPGFKNLAAMLGIRLIAIPFKNSSLDTEILMQKCHTEKIKGVYLSPDHHNPTTLSMTLPERQTISGIIKKFSLICIEDATYSFLQEKMQIPLSACIPEQCIYISTVSNAICPGFRISFMKIPDAYRATIADGIRNINVMSSPFDAETISKLIDTGLASVIIQKNIEEIRNRNRVVNQILDSSRLQGGLNSHFRWLYLQAGSNSSDFEKLAAEHGIQIFSSERFLVGNTVTPPAVRIAITSPGTLEELVCGLTILKSITVIRSPSS